MHAITGSITLNGLVINLGLKLGFMIMDRSIVVVTTGSTGMTNTHDFVW